MGVSREAIAGMTTRHSKRQRRPDRVDAMMQVGCEGSLVGLDGPPLRLVDGASGHRLKVAFVDAEAEKGIDPKHAMAEIGTGAGEFAKWRSARRTLRNSAG